MGLHMDDIHTPTVPSGPASAQGSYDKEKKDMSLVDLIAEKKRLEEELSALGSVLDSVSAETRLLSNQYSKANVFRRFKHGVNMNTTLTTFDGYPRDDLDIAQSV